MTRYIDLVFVLWGEWISWYNFFMKLFFIGSTVYIIYLMRYRFRYVSLCFCGIPLAKSKQANERPFH